MLRFRRPPSFLRTLLLGLLALGVLIQPVVSALADVHVLEHAAATLSDHGHAHHGGHDEPAPDGDPSGDAVGAHALMHGGAVVVSMTLPELSASWIGTRFGSVAPNTPATLLPPSRPLTLPFRPPIA